jgi:TonB-dependent receptor
LCLLAVRASLSAATGTVSGKVADRESGDPLPGANVIIPGTSIGASTDLDGKYSLKNVPAGRQSMKVTYIGYRSVTVELIVGENATLTQDFRLVSQALEGQTVVVTGQAKGQMEAINQQLSSNNIVNVVSAEKMKELPDANLAESIGRLPGVSIQREAGEASKIVVRGLSPKFNRVTVEGVPMVSTSNSDRSIDLSLIGDDLIKGVELSKSLRADLDADAIGGSVNLTLRQAPEGLHYDASANGGYNQLHKDWKNGKFVASVSDRFFDNSLGARVQVSVEQKEIPSQVFGGNYSSAQLYPGTDQFYIQTESAVLTDTYQKRRRNAGSAIIDYASDFVDLSFFNLFSEKNDDVTTGANTISFLNAGSDGGFSRLYSVVGYKTSERTHALQSLFKIGDTKLNLSAAYTNATTDAPGLSFPMIEDQTQNVFSSPAEFQNAQPSVLIAKMGASNPAHTFIGHMSNVFNTTLLDENYDGKLDYKVPFKFSEDISGTLSVGGKYHGVRRQSDGSFQFFNLEYGGGQIRRDFLSAHFPFIPYQDNQHGISVAPFIDPNYNPGPFLDGRYALDWGVSYPLLNYVGSTMYNFPGAGDLYFRDGAQDFQNDYHGLEDTYAAYGMAELGLLDNRLNVLPGMRFEREVTQYQAYAITTNGSNGNGLQGMPISVTANRRNDLWFPSVNLKYKVTDAIQVMGAAYKSEAKPNFLEISPLVIYYNPTASNSFQSQNPFLRPATAINYDLSVSVFNNEIGLFTIGGFYKEISGLLVSLQNYQPFQTPTWRYFPADLPGRLPPFAYYDTTWFRQNPVAATTIPINNPEKAYIRGIEFSWQTHFWYLPGFLTGLVLDLNLSFIGSNTQYPYFNTVTVGYSGTRVKIPITELQYATRSGAVVDQPKSIANAILGWDYMGFSTRVSFRYQQTTLTSLDEKFSLSDSYYDNFLLIDVSAKQQILDNLAVFANFTNLTSHIDDYYINGVIGQLPTRSQSYGLRGQFGVMYNY